MMEGRVGNCICRVLYIRLRKIIEYIKEWGRLREIVRHF